MKRKTLAKYSFIFTLLIVITLGLLGVPTTDVKADPPDPTPTPAMNVKTKLQPYQPPGIEPPSTDGRLYEEAPAPSEAESPPISAQAQDTFLSTADATVREGYSSQNYGNTSDMWAGYDDSLTPDGKIACSLIKFNIASLPSNQMITKATLRVHLVGSWDYPNTYRTITAYRITSNWSENNVTWNNKPGYGQAYGSKSIRNDDFKWHEFDVTDLVAAWYNGTYTNHGIMLRGPEISGIDSSWRSFSTREGSFTPQLVIEYAPNNGNSIEPPTNLTALALSQQQILLNWDDNSNNETGFKIEQSLNGVSGWVQIVTTPANVTSHAPPGLNCNTRYYYRVRAYNASVNSDYSNVANAKTLICPTSTPIAPSNLIATADSTSQISLSWQDNSDDEDGFKIERAPDGANWTQIATAGANDESYLDTGLECDTTYFYRVRAHNANGNSEYSNTDNATTAACNYDIYLPIIMKPPPPPDTLLAIQDADVIQGLPTSNFGNSLDMWVGYVVADCPEGTPAGQIARSLVQFDTSNIPPGTSISQATLNIRLVVACWIGSSTNTVTAYRASGNWSESSVTWNTQPGSAEAYGSVSISFDSDSDWYSIDITDLVRGWVNGTLPNNGLMLRGPESSGNNTAWFGFTTHDWSGTSNDPYISITYPGSTTSAEVSGIEEIPLSTKCNSIGEDVIVCSLGEDFVEQK